MAIWLLEDVNFINIGQELDGTLDGTKEFIVAAIIPCCQTWAENMDKFQWKIKPEKYNYPGISMLFTGERITHCPYCGQRFWSRDLTHHGGMMTTISKATRRGIRQLRKR